MEEYSDICALLGLQENHLDIQFSENSINYDYNENLPNGLKYEIGDSMQNFAEEFAQFEKCALDKSEQARHDTYVVTEANNKKQTTNENDLFDPDDLLDILAEGERGEVHAGSNFSDGYEMGCPGVSGNYEFDIHIEELAQLPFGKVTGSDLVWDQQNSIQFNERASARGEERLPEVSHIVSKVSGISKQYQSLDLMDIDSDSGVDSMNSMSPQESLSNMASPPELPLSSPSPPPSPQSIPINSSIPDLFSSQSKKAATLPSPSIESLLPNSPLSKTELYFNECVSENYCPKSVSQASVLKSELGLLPEFHDTSTLFAVPPSLLTVQNYYSRKTPCNPIGSSNSSSSQLPTPLSPPITHTQAGPPLVRTKQLQSKKPSLLSSLLSIPPIETESSKQLASLLNREMSTSISSILSSLAKQSKQESQLESKVEDGDVYSEFVEFININSGEFVSPPSGSFSTQVFPAPDSSQQKDNGGTEQDVKPVPTLENELIGIKSAVDDSREIPERKKLIINKRKKELVCLSVGGISMESLLKQTSVKVIQPWDVDLRMQMVGVGGIPVATPAFVCGSCGFRSSDKQSLDTHQLSHAIEKPFPCPTCGLGFVTSSARSAHRRQVHQRHHLCQTCDRAFSTSQKLDRHLRTHTGVKEFKCETCKKEFSLEENLKMHYNVHLGKKNFSCYICQREYFTRSGLNHHLKQVHGNEKLVKCSKCDFIGKTRYDVETHHKIDHVESTLKCDLCSQQFQNKQELKKHIMDYHSGSRQFSCTVCSHKSKSQSKLDIHMRQHSLNKIHSCKHCGQKFAFKNSLTKHLSKGRCIILKKSMQSTVVPNLADPTLCQKPGPSL